MDRKTLEREKRVILYGQSARFRVAKYAILIPLFAGLYAWKGLRVTLIALAIALGFAIFVHLFYRSKTNAWRKPWGGFTPLD
jgi:hypothetical protein